MILEPVHQNHWKTQWFWSLCIKHLIKHSDFGARASKPLKKTMILEPVYEQPLPVYQQRCKLHGFWYTGYKINVFYIVFDTQAPNSLFFCVAFDTLAPKPLLFRRFLIHRFQTHCFLQCFWYTGSKTIAFYKVFDPQVSNSLFFTMFLIHSLRNHCVLQWQINRSLALVLLLKFGFVFFSNLKI